MIKLYYMILKLFKILLTLPPSLRMTRVLLVK